MTADKEEMGSSPEGEGVRARGRPRYEDILTPTEWRVLHAAQHGSTNRAIAAKLNISADGVKYHMANILGKLGVANRQALKSWFQAPRGSALASAESGLSSDPLEVREMTKAKQAAMMQSLGQVSRTVRSLEESVDFYQGKLGIPHLYSFGNLGFFDLAGTRLFLNETEELNENESLLYFAVADIQKTCADLEGLGVTISNQPHLIHTHENGTEEWMAFLNDPEGRPLGLMSTVRKLD